MSSTFTHLPVMNGSSSSGNTAATKDSSTASTQTSTKGSAELLLARQLKELQRKPVEGFSAGLVDEANLFLWEVCVIGPAETPYEGGLFRGRLEFPTNYPLMPPKLTFTTSIWHPNIYKDGRVCISILHPPGEDENGCESAAERWLPVHTITTIMVSVISLLSSPNDSSPANVEAAVHWRTDKDTFNKRVRLCVRKSQEDL